jgi:hypothetical protein
MSDFNTEVELKFVKKAALSVYWAWKNLEDSLGNTSFNTTLTGASDIVSYCDDMANSMHDLSTWLPGYDSKTGEIPDEGN